MQYTNYNKSLSAYVTAEKKQHPTYGGKSISTSTYTSYIDPSKDTTNNFQFLTLDTYREVDPTAYNNLLNSKLRSNSVLRNKGNVLIAAAKQFLKLDMVQAPYLREKRSQPLFLEVLL